MQTCTQYHAARSSPFIFQIEVDISKHSDCEQTLHPIRWDRRHVHLPQQLTTMANYLCLSAPSVVWQKRCKLNYRNRPEPAVVQFQHGGKTLLFYPYFAKGLVYQKHLLSFFLESIMRTRFSSLVDESIFPLFGVLCWNLFVNYFSCVCCKFIFQPVF